MVRPPPRGGGQNFSLLATVLRGLAGWLVALLVAFVVFFASATVKENFFSPFSGDPAPLLAPPPRQLCLPLTTVFTATLNACPSSSQLFQQFSEMGLCRLCLFRGRVRGQQLLWRRCCGQRAGPLVVCGAAARRCGAFGPRSVVATSGRCRCGGYQRCVSSAVAPLLRSFRTEACASLLGRAHSCAASLDAVQAGDPAPLLAPPPRQLCLPLTTVFTATLNACPSSSQLFQQFSEMGLCRLCLFRGRVRGQQLLWRRCCGQRAGPLVVCGAAARRCGAFGPRSVVATSGRRFASMATHTTSD